MIPRVLSRPTLRVTGLENNTHTHSLRGENRVYIQYILDIVDHHSLAGRPCPVVKDGASLVMMMLMWWRGAFMACEAIGVYIKRVSIGLYRCCGSGCMCADSSGSFAAGLSLLRLMDHFYVYIYIIMIITELYYICNNCWGYIAA